jgi:hypothetical protein
MPADTALNEVSFSRSYLHIVPVALPMALLIFASSFESLKTTASQAGVDVAVAVNVGVDDAVGVIVLVFVIVLVGVAVGVSERVKVSSDVGVPDKVHVAVRVGVCVPVDSGVEVVVKAAWSVEGPEGDNFFLQAPAAKTMAMAIKRMNKVLFFIFAPDLFICVQCSLEGIIS